MLNEPDNPNVGLNICVLSTEKQRANNQENTVCHYKSLVLKDLILLKMGQLNVSITSGNSLSVQHQQLLCIMTLGALAQLTRLTELSLRFCKGVVPSDLSAISRLERLKSLDINGCLACTDASLGCLHPLKGLRQLNIGFNKQLTDAALKQLTGLTHLQHLLLNNCPLLTEAALDLLLTALPSLAKMTTIIVHVA